ncbi:MAG: 2-amino-4-hydroxy-6-hydroxymethyldihydropteridine diphosphokinase [Mycobacteriaceae bacterium]
MSTAVLSIGSNMGDRLGHLQSVVDGLGSAVTACSAVFCSAPWGGVDQEDFLNAVLLVDSPDTDCWGWLRRGQALEASAHRERVVRWGPRSLDVDVIECDGTRSTHPDLLLPHPRAHERAFVLAPWLDVDAGAQLTGHGPVVELLAALPSAERNGVRLCGSMALRLVRP